jgi:hypothetical protein
MGIEHALYGHYFSSILKLVGVQQAAMAATPPVLAPQYN